MPDTYTLDFWHASLEASWRGTSLKPGWNTDRLDWARLLWAGKYNRVLESFARVWSSLPGLPALALNESWAAAQMARRSGQAAMELVHDVMTAADRYGLRLALLKSPSYVLDAFPGFEDRQVRDVDILARPNDAAALSAALEERGYSLVKRLRYQWVFSRGGMTIEVHFSPTSRRRFQRLLHTDSLLERAGIHPRWAPLLRLSIADEALLLTLHAYHHCFREILWLRDLAGWWRVRQPDPQEVLSVFERLGLTRTGWMAWRGMEWLGWSMPQGWTAELWRAGRRFDRLVQSFWDGSAMRTGNPPRLELLCRWLELGQAQGVDTKLRALSPWFSLRNLQDLRKSWVERDYCPPMVQMWRRALNGASQEVCHVESEKRCRLA